MMYDLIATTVDNDKVRRYDLHADQVLVLSNVPYLEAQAHLMACLQLEDVVVTTISQELQYADSGKEFIEALSGRERTMSKKGLLLVIDQCRNFRFSMSESSVLAGHCARKSLI